MKNQKRGYDVYLELDDIAFLFGLLRGIKQKGDFAALPQFKFVERISTRLFELLTSTLQSNEVLDEKIVALLSKKEIQFVMSNLRWLWYIDVYRIFEFQTYLRSEIQITNDIVKMNDLLFLLGCCDIVVCERWSEINKI